MVRAEITLISLPLPRSFANASSENGAKTSRSSRSVMKIGRHCAALPLLDPRRTGEIIGYRLSLT
jgi:hypothetical protein